MTKTVLACLLTLPVTLAADWPHFRGPMFNGSTDEKDLPVSWSRTENIVWRAKLPGAAAATPIISGDHVFVSSTDAQRDALTALCFDRLTGKRLWDKEIAQGMQLDSRSNYASPSPTTDGKVVVFFYGNGDLVAFDFQGKQLWRRNIQDDYGSFAFMWTFSTSPTLFDGRLYLQVLQRDVPVDGRGIKDRMNRSYLLAMDPETGETLWRKFRPSQAQMESREAFSTPVPYQHSGRTDLLVIGGDDLTGHDPATGKELWRWGTWNPQRITHWRLVPSPVAGNGIILACAPKQDPIYAIRAGGKGLLNGEAIAWSRKSVRALTSDVPTPAFYEGDFFVLSDIKKRLLRVDPRDGTVKWNISTPGLHKYEASPLAADGKIYLINFSGNVVVVDAEKGILLSQNSMDEPADDPVRSSVIAASGNLFVRVNRTLYCVGEG